MLDHIMRPSTKPRGSLGELAPLLTLVLPTPVATAANPEETEGAMLLLALSATGELDRADTNGAPEAVVTEWRGEGSDEALLNAAGRGGDATGPAAADGGPCERYPGEEERAMCTELPLKFESARARRGSSCVALMLGLSRAASAATDATLAKLPALLAPPVTTAASTAAAVAAGPLLPDTSPPVLPPLQAPTLPPPTPRGWGCGAKGFCGCGCMCAGSWCCCVPEPPCRSDRPLQ